MEVLLRVLVVDDSAALRERLRVHAEEVAGVRVVAEAQDGRQALALLDSADPHVVVLDLRMPGLSGFATLEAIKASRRPRTVIVMTNYAYPQYRDRCMAGGADYFLDKSADFARLPQILGDLAGRRGGGGGRVAGEDA